MYASSWWISFLDNKRCDWFKTLKYENFETWEIWQAYISIQVDPNFFGKVNIATVTDSGYKLLLEKHNNQLKKREILFKS